MEYQIGKPRCTFFAGKAEGFELGFEQENGYSELKTKRYMMCMYTVSRKYTRKLSETLN